ncbi:MAG: bifunctional diguanylate cyclase/phosphodiesterase [Pseudomonadota bacterium]
MASIWSKVVEKLGSGGPLSIAAPAALAFLPAISLAAYWFGAQGVLVVLACLLPVLYIVRSTARERGATTRGTSGGWVEKIAFEQLSAGIFAQAKNSGRQSAALHLQLDDFDKLIEQHGQTAADIVVERVGQRIAGTLRGGDCVTLLGDGRFGICLEPVRHLDLELCIQMTGRLQAAVEEPVSVDDISVYVSASIGFCQLKNVPGNTSTDWMKAAATALREARQRGPSSVRAFSDQMRFQMQARAELREEVAAAIDSGQIHPWFQPQISTDTGRITGFEALARWSHPDRGMIPPIEFLPAVEQAGQLERLAETMMYHSFTALNAWDEAGVEVPQIGVNFAGSELSNPKLLDKIKWELDRFELTPDRLAVEVLETVVASAPDDTITRNINALSKIGCRIDLDDFGTGHASIASIRRFSVNRIKIDRSFVMKSDKDPDQQRMIGAILTMAERLQVETLAEGVETVGEHVLLAQLGCDHVQGYGIARPMPFEQTLDWIHTHNAKLKDVPTILQTKNS